VIFDAATKSVFTANGLDANIVIFKQFAADKYAMSEALQTRAGMRVMVYDSETQKIHGMTAEGTLDPTKKNLAFISPFYPNTVFPGTFVMLTFGRGPAAGK
jgi:hypothetical protein